MSTIDNSNKSCNTGITMAVMCVDYLDTDCRQKSVDTSTIGAPVCCVGTQSCQYASNITATLGNLTSSNLSGDIRDTAVRCDAHFSCHQVPSLIRSQASGTIDESHAGNLYFTGWVAGQGISSNEAAIIETTMNYDIFATGYQSLEYQMIQNADNLYCGGVHSCAYAPLISNINSIFSYGYNGAFYATMNHVSTIYCGAYRSCYSTNISNILKNVYGTGYQVLYSSIISNVKDTLVGAGYQALYQSHITNVTNVCCYI